MRIALTHNLKSNDSEEQAEFDSPKTIAWLCETLRGLGHEVDPVDVGGPITQLIARLEALRPDLVFNMAEGTHGRYREAFYPALFDQLKLPFTGSAAHVCALTLDKKTTKLMVAAAGIPTPQWAFFDQHNAERVALELRFPVIVKPNFEGSSKGITARSVVHNEDDLWALITQGVKDYPLGVLVEEFIIGQDVTVPFLEAHGVLTPASYVLNVADTEPGYAIYDYALKNDMSDLVDVHTPAPFDDETMDALKHHTARIMQELEIRDLGRADFRVTEDGEVFFIEVNALPSLEPGASIYVSSEYDGVGDAQQVLEVVLQSACARQPIPQAPARRSDAVRVGLIYNLRRVSPQGGQDEDAEFDSQQTVDAIAASIERLGHEVTLLEATPQLPRLIGEAKVDLVFNIAEGIRGRNREAQVPALLELLGIEYTGSDAAALCVTLDKALAKRLARSAGVATARWELLGPEAPIKTELTFPLIAKPNAEGSSKGVTATSVVREPGQLRAAVEGLRERYHSGVLLEEFLTGREFTVGLLGEHDPTTLPIMEIVFEEADLPIYSYEHKTEEQSGVRFDVPARVDDALRAQLERTAKACFEALGCRDVARIDLRLDADGVPHFIECNPLPGLSPGFSDLCVIAEAAGMDYGALIAAILAPGIRRVSAQREVTS